MQSTRINPDQFIRSLVSRAYPSYRGRKYRLRVSDASIDCASYWRRTYFRSSKSQRWESAPALSYLRLRILETRPLQEKTPVAETGNLGNLGEWTPWNIRIRLMG